jgi:acyl transferase domain-containing protein/3-hydroxymyristoyl/3-hydroxydecanoyl-(acyl carrier protein) dehydratase
MAGLFPGAETLDAFFSNVLEKKDATREVPAGRWLLEPSRAKAREAAEPDRVASVRGCFVDLERPLDLDGLAVGRELALSLDPLCRLVLHVGRAAFRSARMDAVDRSRTGVVLANIALPTDGASRIADEVFAFGAEAVTAGSALDRWVTALPAGLLARALGLGGGSYTLDAACASSLYALQLACDELRSGRAEAMLAGGASRPDALYTQMGFSQLRALSASGRCSPFDARGDGLVVGEGAGIFVLKRLDDALAAGDEILGVIRGIGLSNDVGGKLLAPDSEGQLRAMRAAYREAGWAPSDVDLIECHGTGTPTGDAVELASLRALWGESGWRPGQCVIGSVKASIGHLLTAAGAAGLVKTLLALRARTLPPQANFERPAPGVALEGSPFEVAVKARPWEAREGRPRRAAVSAFGFGGINAHVLVEEYAPRSSPPPLPASIRERAKGAAASRGRGSAIAIVGMEARFGSLGSLRAFQEAVLNGTSAVGDRPRSRWRGLDRPGFRGAYLEALEVAPGEFRIPPNEVAQLLPQQLLMLQVAKAALADAGVALTREPRLRAGVVVGMSLDLNTTNYHLRWAAQARGVPAATVDQISPALNAPRTLGALGGMIASRIARELDLGGPSFAVSGEEASGLRSLEVAARALERGELDLAIAGAVDLAGDARAVLAQDRVRPWSRKGEARPFEASADGSVPGEGACAVVLKRLEDAERDGDRIYAVFRGLGASSDYATAVERAREAAGPAPVSYLEAHGSGDPEEDALEARALAAVGRDGGEPCALGSAKAIVGHTGAAAGLASVVKASLCLFQEILPPLPGFERARPELAGAYHVPRAPLPWLRDRIAGPRRAGVSALSTDGNCVHVILEGVDRPASAHAAERRQPLGARSEALFAVEADDMAGLARGLDALVEHATAAHPTGGAIEALARSWWARTGSHPGRRSAVTILARDAATLARRAAEAKVAVLEDRALDGRNGVRHAPRPIGPLGEVAFVFPGSGNHYAGMGRGLSVEWPEVVRALDAENERLASQVMPRWLAPYRLAWGEGWEADAAAAIASDHHRMIFGQVTHGVLVSDVLRALGVKPQAAIGYSLGESTSLFALRAWRARDAMLARMLASDLFKDELAASCKAARRALGVDRFEWKAVLVNRAAAAVRAALTGSAWLLIVNAPDECVIGGERAAVDAAVLALACEAFPLEGVPSVHCAIAREVETAYRDLHVHAVTAPAGVRYYSGVLARSYDVTTESAAASITDQATRGFDFQALVERAYADGVRVFVEAGPQGSCTRAIAKILGARPHLALTACVRGQEDRTTILRLLARLVAERVPVDLGGLYGEETRALGHAPPAVKVRGAIVIPLDLPAPVFPRVEPVIEKKPLRVTQKIPVPAFVRPEREPVPEGLGAVSVARATASAHEAFLAVSARATRAIGERLAFQTRLYEALLVSGETPTPALPHSVGEGVRAPFMDRAACLEFARGEIGKVLGAAFAPIDAHPTRVRLPDEPLMLCDRILSVSGEPGSLKSGRLVTEHDVLPGAWYLDEGRAPVCVSVEAGQADLFLSAYLGIDHETKGERRYRLLDAVVTFHRALPRVGDVIRYEIAIDRFVRQGSTYLFFFRFEGFLGTELLLTMTEGCAGFFSASQLDDSQGIVLTDAETAPVRGKREGFTDLAPMKKETFDARALDALRAGALEEAFGADFASLDLRDPIRLPGGRMKLIDRVVALDPRGGRFGLGRIRAEADVHPDDWYLTCHFKDDPVMPGTLMYECCLHTLRVFLTRMGWVFDRGEVGYEPIPGVASRLRCRGQVTPLTKTVAYELDLKEIGYGPEPYAIADALMFADGKRVVRMENMSVRLSGLARDQVEALWAKKNPHSHETRFIGDTPVPTGLREAVFDGDRILAFAIGKPSVAFGEPYRVFDSGRKIARLPGPPYQFLDRVTDVSGARPWKLEPGGWIEAQYEVPTDAWYFRANRQRSMPFSVLLEVALQPCGWLAAYMGSALRSETDLKFRNLGGKATQHEEVFADGGTLTTRVRLSSFSEAGGMIIQKYDLELFRAGNLVYEGETSFGFFSKAALAQQVGVRGARPWVQGDMSRAVSIVLPGDAPLTPDDSSSGEHEAAALPAGAYRMVREVALLRDGGPAGLGFLRGTTDVDASAWFFRAHFFEDPVWPGSLGLESFLQLLKVYLRDRFPGLHGTHRFEPIWIGEPHTWAYRGQIIPTNKRVTVEAVVTEVGEGTVKANGFLSVDGITIYEMKDFGLRLVPAR